MTETFWLTDANTLAQIMPHVKANIDWLEIKMEIKNLLQMFC